MHDVLANVQAKKLQKNEGKMPALMQYFSPLFYVRCMSCMNKNLEACNIELGSYVSMYTQFFKQIFFDVQWHFFRQNVKNSLAPKNFPEHYYVLVLGHFRQTHLAYYIHDPATYDFLAWGRTFLNWFSIIGKVCFNHNYQS